MSIEMTSHTIIRQMEPALKGRVQALTEAGHQPHLAVILVGHDPQSELYVSSIKRRQAEALGIDYTIHRFDEQTEEATVLQTIEQLNREVAVSGIIIQLPLPAHLDTDKLINAVDRHKDVDGLTQHSPFTPPTVSAILELLAAYDIPLVNKNIVVVGQGRLVGKPLLAAFRAMGLPATACDDSIGEALGQCTLQADILVSATGEENLITPAMVKEGAVVIDVDHDVVYDQVEEKVGFITPQKGGVGPLTVMFLLMNVVEAAEGTNN